MPTLMFASSSPIPVDTIQPHISDSYESAIESKMGGRKTFLAVRKEGKAFLNFEQFDDARNSIERGKLKDITEPAEFVELVAADNLYFVIVTFSDQCTEEVEAILQVCAEESLIEFDVTDEIKRLDGGPIVM